MDNIKISDIDKLIHVEFAEKLDEIKADVKASLDIEPMGDFIKITGNVTGKIVLTCDLCLKDYDYELDFAIDEMYAKGTFYEGEKQEIEIKDGQFVTDLNGAEELDIYDLLYQSVILELPNKKVCGINCNEELFAKDDSFEVHDSRMDVFKTIKIDK